MLGVYERRKSCIISMGSMTLLGEAKLQLYYNDEENGTGKNLK